MIFDAFDEGDCLAFGCKADMQTGNAKSAFVVQKDKPNRRIGVAIYEKGEWKPRWVSPVQLLCPWDSYQRLNFSKEKYAEERDEWTDKLKKVRGMYAGLRDKLAKMNIPSSMYVPVTNMPQGLILDDKALHKILQLIER